MLPALLISRSERSIVRVSIYNSSQPQVICPPAEYLDFPEFNYSSNLLDYNTMATTAAGIQQQQVIGLGAAYDRQQRWVAIIMGTILRKYIIVSWVISSIAAPIPAGTIPFDQAAICPERLMKLSIWSEVSTTWSSRSRSKIIVMCVGGGGYNIHTYIYLHSCPISPSYSICV